MKRESYVFPFVAFLLSLLGCNGDDLTTKHPEQVQRPSEACHVSNYTPGSFSIYSSSQMNEPVALHVQQQGSVTEKQFFLKENTPS